MDVQLCRYKSKQEKSEKRVKQKGENPLGTKRKVSSH
jgi:hypothetical protein